MLALSWEVTLLCLLLFPILLVASSRGIRILDAPFDAIPVVNALWWHPVHNRDPEHAWMRSIFEEAAQGVAARLHAEADA